MFEDISNVLQVSFDKYKKMAESTNNKDIISFCNSIMKPESYKSDQSYFVVLDDILQAGINSNKDDINKFLAKTVYLEYKQSCDMFPQLKAHYNQKFKIYEQLD